MLKISSKERPKEKSLLFVENNLLKQFAISDYFYKRKPDVVTKPIELETFFA